MLTRLVRIQLVIFSVAALFGGAVMVLGYMQAPVLLGFGRINVTLELDSTGGLYRFANVTYRGIEVGKVTDVKPTRDGAVATMSLKKAPKIPADLEAQVHSVSAVGEQYVDLLPRSAAGPYLQNGSTITTENTSTPRPVREMLDRVSGLIDSVPEGQIDGLLDESFKALNGTGYDLGSLLDSSSMIAADANGIGEDVRALLDDSRPLLDGQAESTEQIRTLARSLAGISDQLATDDPAIRTILQSGSGAADEAAQMLNQVKPTLPVLLANLISVGQIGVTYHPSIEQLLVLLPPYLAATQSYGSSLNNPTGMALSEFSLTLGDPPACSVGFLPPSSWRSPADLTDIDTPDGLYCKLPQDSPIGVRGARNFPCMGKPGKRAPTVEICESDKPYEPLAMRQHVTGPYPIDPALIAQGIPPDDRIDFSDQIFGPIEGTPAPPAEPAAPAEPAEPAEPAAPAPAAVPATPSAYAPARSGPSVAIATYNPQTGQYATPDGGVYSQSDLVTATPTDWTQMLPR
ncbi:MCE family protein [Mycobacterium koreense]|uniref:Virulence factor Mce n=1 Tax=Mycolicibacillus koreensis TaxID=1069220 RepID=A0A7I7SHM7_9MYCO|nr:MlaD family protein [Mycolicibacillus koreensis]MCV7247235.1 MCE family protein [Mycolicibacillus koreensis]ODR06662.1 virulence factor Mce [Mycolicibacillus koreensis]OSC34244.1 virulence factor Mce [Mycolicibacillus koreensis]BBY56424.1 virulence factor Mce [Mycolicibacillus koreensis]